MGYKDELAFLDALLKKRTGPEYGLLCLMHNKPVKHCCYPEPAKDNYITA